MQLLKTRTTHHLKLNQQVMIEEFQFPPLRPAGYVPRSGGGGVHSFIWPLGVGATHQGIAFSSLHSWKGCLFGRKVFLEALKWMGTLPMCGLHEWHHHFKNFVLWCHLFNKILDSVCEIKSGWQRKYPVLHKVTKGTDFALNMVRVWRR